MRYLLITLFPFFLFASDKNSKDQPNWELEKAKINHIIQTIETSDQLIFIRNGTEHDHEEAADHIKGKYRRARRKFMWFGSIKNFTVKDFIEKLASLSLTTGKPYKVKLPNGKVITAEKWMKGLIQNFRATQSSGSQ